MTRAKDISKILTDADLSGTLDVTGTVTAGGLDIQGDGTISGGSRLTISDIADENNDGIRLDDSTTARFNNLTQDSSGNFKIQHWTGSAWQNNLTLTTGGTLEITKGASGASANAAADELVLQNSGDAGLSILSPNANNSQILLGSPVANAGGIIRWTGDDNAVKIGTNNTGSTLRFHVGGFSEVMRISSAGFVGINTSSPNSRLTSASTDGSTGLSIHRTFSGNVSGETTVGGLDFTLTDTATSNQIVSRISPVGSAGTGDAFAGAMRFYTAGNDGSIAERMRIHSGGQLSLATTDATHGFNVGQSGTDFRGRFQGNNQYRLGLQNGTSGLVWLGSGGADNFRISNSAGSTRFEIDSGGNGKFEGSGDCTLSITANSTSHDSKIDFVQGSSIEGGITYDHNGSFGSEKMAFRAGNNGTHMYLTGNGNVGIGNSNPEDFGSLVDNLVIGTTSGENGMTIASGTANSGRIQFADNTSSPFRGAIEYSHGNDALMLYTAGTQRLYMGNDGATKITSLAGSNYVLRLHNDRNNNDGYGLHLQVGADDPSGTHYQIDFADGDGTLQGSISSNSGTVTYGAFTAFHPCIIPNADNDADSVANAYPYGTLLEITSLSYTQKNGADTERGILYNVQKSSSAKSKAVLGAYGSSMNSADRGDTNLHQALILGDGHILCNNENGNIAIGDYICTSSTSGEGMKATNICTTIGIAREAITFSNSTAVLVAVEYGYRQFIPEDLEARITTLEGE